MRWLFVLLLAASFVSAGVFIEPKSVGNSRAVIELNWDIDFNGQAPVSASFSSFLFLNTSTQSVFFTASKQFTVKSDEFGNQLLTFELDPTLQRQRVSMTAEVTGFPEGGFEQVENMVEFTQPSQYVDITPEISAKAQEIIAGESNPFKQAALLTSWVHNNVVYDLSYQDAILRSSEVFRVRRGVCNEYSHLLIAMLRSVGIPARFVAGFVYSGEIWAPHAWVEVAINGKWYPFDPTYNEGIVLDGTHFKFANGIDQANVVEQFSARGNIDLAQVSLKRSHDVSFLTSGNFSKPPFLAVSAPNETAQSNSIQNISVSITSRSPNAVTYPISIDVPEEVTVLSEKTRLIFLLPGETYNYSWQLLIPVISSDEYIYTYPVIARTLGAKTETVFQAKKGNAESIAIIQVKEIRRQGSDLVIVVKNSRNTQFDNVTTFVNVSNRIFFQRFSLEAGKEVAVIFSIASQNLSTPVKGKLNLTAGNYSLLQPFLLAPSRSSPGPADPALNLQTTRSLLEAPTAFEPYAYLLPYLAAILLIFTIAIVIVVKLRA